MQETSSAKDRALVQVNRSFLVISSIFFLIVILGCVELLVADTNSALFRSQTNTAFSEKTLPLNGAERWVNDHQTTTPGFNSNFSLQGNQTINTSPIFAQYYTHHQGSSTLGPPVTVAFPIHEGWIQFFASGPLLLPGSQSQSDANISDPLRDVIKAGVRDAASGILRLPLLQALLTAGSLLQVGGPGASLTYVDLRKATNPALMVATPRDDSASNTKVFVKTGTRDGADVGHLIPQVF